MQSQPASHGLSERERVREGVRERERERVRERESERERERAYKITGGETGLCGILWSHTELRFLKGSTWNLGAESFRSDRVVSLLYGS